MLRTEMFSHELKSVDAIKNVIDGTVRTTLYDCALSVDNSDSTL